MSNDALTRSEWAAARRRIVEELGDDVLADKIEDTFTYGIQPGEPTSEELDEWAATSIMGWREGRREAVKGFLDRLVWEDKDGKYVHTIGAASAYPWKPSSKLSHTFRAAMETDINVDVRSHRRPDGTKKALAFIGGEVGHTGPFDEEVICREIMLELWRRLEKGEA